MELSSQLKKYRSRLNLSQEELAEKIYVTRQTISNWENEKSYPDIHSLLLLSSLFDVSLDQLIKGDVETMKEEIRESEISRLHRYSIIYTGLLAACIISFPLLYYFFDIAGMIPWVILYAVTMIIAWKIEKMKKQNHIHTYKEIVAFMNGERLDEITAQREIGKWPYQKILLVAGSGLIALVVMCAVGMILKYLAK